MILADKIINLRKKAYLSQEELAEKLGVSRQAISKWESAQSIPDLDKIIALSKLFSVTTDFLLKDEIEIEENVKEENVQTKKLSMQMANDFIIQSYKISGKIALGTLLCILSPIILILTAFISDIYHYDDKIIFFGIIVLFILLIIAISLFITSGNKVKEYYFLENGKFETEYGVTSFSKEKKKDLQEKYDRNNLIGVILTILSVIPLFIALYIDKEIYIGYSICLLLMLVGFGVYLMVSVGVKMGALKKILEEDEFSREIKENNASLSIFTSCFFIAVTIIFIFLSFVFNMWDISWIIWPIAGLLYSALAMIIKNKKKK